MEIQVCASARKSLAPGEGEGNFLLRVLYVCAREFSLRVFWGRKRRFKKCTSGILKSITNMSLALTLY